MMRAGDIARWLGTLDAGTFVGIDEGGLCLVVAQGDPDDAPYLEVGGVDDYDGVEPAEAPM